MLANGATLAYKSKTESGAAYTTIPGLKEIPDLGVEPEKVENTTLTDPHKKYEIGIGDLPDMTYRFKYENDSAQSGYRVMRTYADSKTVLAFKETDQDGATVEFDAQCSVKRLGGGVNGVIDWELTLYVQSDMSYTDPT